jgi:hypothetical protein
VIRINGHPSATVLCAFPALASRWHGTHIVLTGLLDRSAPYGEMRTLAASPDYVAGSVHALTDGGSMLVASASGSQLGPLASGPGR